MCLPPGGQCAFRPAAGRSMETCYLDPADCRRCLQKTYCDQNNVFQRGKCPTRQSKITIVVPSAPRLQVYEKSPARQATVLTQ